MSCGIRLVSLTAFLAAHVFAAAPVVRTAPAVSGSGPTHAVLSGRATTLKGTSSQAGPHVEATWDFGDGSEPVTMAVSDGYNVSVQHTYSGAVGTVFTATLTVLNAQSGESGSATYQVATLERTLQVQTAIALDEALWYLHRTMSRSLAHGRAGGDWRGHCDAVCDESGAANASNVLAFEMAGFLASGDVSNPYTETVARGLHSLLRQAGDPAVRTADWVRAIEAAGDPEQVAEAGPVDIQGQTYGDLIQRFGDQGNPLTSAAALRAASADVTAATARALIDRQNQAGYWSSSGPQPEVETARAVITLAALSASTIFDVSSQVSVTTSGLLYSRATRTFNGTLTVTNISAAPIPGPIDVVLTNLTPGVTLANSDGTFNGHPYRVVPGVTTLGPGQAAPASVSFNNPGSLLTTFTPVTYSGTFPPAAVAVACPAVVGVNGVPYSSALLGSGGVQPYTYSINPGSLPIGLNLNPTTGAIAGLPTVSGPVSFTANLADGTGLPSGRASASCTITINPALSLACAAGDGQVGTLYSSSLTAAGGIAGYTFALTGGALPTPLQLNAGTGAITGTPDTAGPASFTVLVTDSSPGTPLTAPASCTITISALANHAPVAAAQGVSTNEGIALPLTLVGTDEDGNPLTFAIVTPPAHGALGAPGSPNCVGNPSTCTASVTYSPAANYNGADSFTFKVNDGITDSPPATVSITVHPVNSAPTANGQSVTTNQNVALPVTLTGNDAETPAANLTFTVSANPTHGVLSGTGANLTYTPDSGFTGSDAFQFTVTDRGKPDNCGAPGPTCAAPLTSAAATITIAINNPPQITSAGSATFAPGKAGQTFTVQTSGFPTGASMSITDGGGFPLSVTLTNNNNGTATIAGTPQAGTQGAVGTPPSKAYPVLITANNGVAPNATQNFTLTIACPAITVSGAAALNLSFNTPMSASPYTQDVGNGFTSWALTGGPSGVSINSGGVVSGTPTQTGTFSATVSFTDAGGCVGTKVVPIAVLPVAVTDSYSTLVDNTQAVVSGGLTASPSTPFATLTGTIIANDLPTGAVAAVAGTSTTSAGGSVTIAADGTFIYTPPARPSLTAITGDSFTYAISSNTGGTPTATTAVGTVSLGLAGRVWYVRSGGSDSLNNGQSQAPFLTLGKAATVSVADDTIYVFSGNDANLGAAALKQGQSLIGQGVNLVVNGRTLVTAGTFPTLGGTLSASGVTGLTVNGLSLSTGSSTAVNFSNSDGNFTFRSISTNGAAIGVNWSAAAQASGSFTVSSSGSGTCTAANTGGCSGGSIANSSDTGIKLTNASNVSLARMRINTSTNFGLNASRVNNMSIDSSVFDGTHGNAVDEGALFVTNWFGSGTLSNSEILGGFNDNVRVNNTSAGTLNRLNVSSTIIRSSGNNHGLAFYGCLNGTGSSCPGVGTMNLTVSNSTFTDNSANSVNINAAETSSMDVVLQSNTFQSTSLDPVTGPSGAVNIGLDHSAHMTLDVNSNTFINPKLSAFTAFASNQTLVAASMIGKIRNNIIGTSGVPLSGSRQGSGMQITATGAATVTLNVTANTIRNWATNNGLDINSGDGVNGSPNVNLTVTGNTLHLDAANANHLHGISANMGTTSSGGAVNACIDVGGAGGLVNNVVGSSFPGGGGFEVRVRQRLTSNVRLPGFPGPNNNGSTSAAAAVTHLGGRNTITTPGTPSTNVFVAVNAPTGGTFSGGAACTQAP